MCSVIFLLPFFQTLQRTEQERRDSQMLLLLVIQYICGSSVSESKSIVAAASFPFPVFYMTHAHKVCDYFMEAEQKIINKKRQYSYVPIYIRSLCNDMLALRQDNAL